MGANMRCAVCNGSDPHLVREHQAQGGARYGMACRGECAGLLWEAHFASVTDSTEFEHSLVLWRWQRRRAEVAGVAFLVPPPSSEVERTCEMQQVMAGVFS